MADLDRTTTLDLTGEHDLVAAIKNNDLAAVRQLLDDNVSPDISHHDDPPLIFAIRHQNLEIVKLLYDYNVCRLGGEFNESELHVAAYNGNLPILEFIWNRLKSRSSNHDFLHHADLDGMTPLHCAADAGSLDIIQFLLREGADVNSGIKHALTPLHCAVRSPNAPQTIEMLIMAGSQVDALDREGRSAIFYAVQDNKPNAVSALLHAGASVKLQNQNRYHETVAHFAASTGSTSLLKTLMDAGVDMTARSISNSTILHHAAELGHKEMVRWILQHTDLPADEPNRYGWTPLLLAASKNDFAVVKFLVEEYGADTSAVTSCPPNIPALHLATYSFTEDMNCPGEKPRPVADDTALVSYLLARGSDVSARVDDSFLIGGYVSGERMLEEFDEIVSGDRGEDTDTVTALDCAAFIGSIPKAQVLLAAGADIHAQSPVMGGTALHHARDLLSMAKFLIENGADVRMPNKKGRNKVHYLCYEFRAIEPVRKFLVDAGAYTEDLEHDLDLTVVARVMKDLIYKTGW